MRPTTFTIREDPPCSFFVDYPNAAVCPGSGNAGGSGGGMSGGSAFLLTIFIIGIVYIAGGCIYKRKKQGTVGMVHACLLSVCLPAYLCWCCAAAVV